MQEIVLFQVNGNLFNNSNADVIIDGVVYASIPFEVEKRVMNANLQADILTIKILFSDAIPDSKAAMELFGNGVVNVWKFKNGQNDVLFSGTIVGFNAKTTFVTIEVQNALHKLQQPATKRYSQKSRASFCDASCTLIAENHTHSGVISQVKPHSFIVAESLPNKHWHNGIVKVVKSDKVYYFSVRGVNGNEILFFDQFPSEIQNGNTFTIKASCNKLLSICSEIYNNAVNFQGEPFIWR